MAYNSVKVVDDGIEIGSGMDKELIPLCDLENYVSEIKAKGKALVEFGFETRMRGYRFAVVLDHDDAVATYRRLASRLLSVGIEFSELEGKWSQFEIHANSQYELTFVDDLSIVTTFIKNNGMSIDECDLSWYYDTDDGWQELFERYGDEEEVNAYFEKYNRDELQALIEKEQNS